MIHSIRWRRRVRLPNCREPASQSDTQRPGIRLPTVLYACCHLGLQLLTVRAVVRTVLTFCGVRGKEVEHDEGDANSTHWGSQGQKADHQGCRSPRRRQFAGCQSIHAEESRQSEWYHWKVGHGGGTQQLRYVPREANLSGFLTSFLRLNPTSRTTS